MQKIWASIDFDNVEARKSSVSDDRFAPPREPLPAVETVDAEENSKKAASVTANDSLSN